VAATPVDGAVDSGGGRFNAAAMGDLDTLADLDSPAKGFAAAVSLRRLADRLEARALEQALADGWTWADVAGALGVTRQAAHKRLAGRARRAAAGAGPAPE
jgi:hypothetical protein